MKPFELKHEYLPWSCTEEQKEAQLEWQKSLKALGNITLGDECFISQEAAFFPSAFRCGDRCKVCAESMVRGTIEMGSDCTINSYTVVAGKIRIGDGVRIASNASIFGFNHGHSDVDRPIHTQPHTQEGIRIEDDVWVGANVVVVDGVTVGAHSILAAGAVVTKDVPPYSIYGGNPGRVLRDRRTPRSKPALLEEKLRSFGETVREEHVEVLNEAFDAKQQCYVDNQQERKPTDRAWCDAVEVAGFFDHLPPHFEKEVLIEKLQSFQNPETGCFDHGLENENPTPIQRLENNGYHYLCVGYALEVLGSHLAHKNQFLDKISAEDLNQRQAALTWVEKAWGSGSWNDHFGTAVYHDLKHHAGAYDLSAFFGWLNLKCSRATGLWGKPTEEQRWLLPVNGFYRLTRGTYAQFGHPLPYPVDAVDTILMHCRQYDDFLDHHVTACNVLDILHPLWLCAKQTDHRAAEITSLMERQVKAMLNRWIPNRGYAFAPGNQSKKGEPGLQGTEMWLSILYIAADYLGMADALGYSPKGVHRTQVALQL